MQNGQDQDLKETKQKIINKKDQNEQDEVEYPTNGPEDVFDIVYTNLKWRKKLICRLNFWGKMFSPSLAIKAWGLR